MKNYTIYKMFLLAMMVLILGTGMAFGQSVATLNGSGEQTFTLYAGQTINVGTVGVKVDNNTLIVTYSTIDGWELTEAHLWVGNTSTDIPQTKTGNPIPGQFPFKSGNITGLTSYTFAIPLANPNINFSCPGSDVIYFMAAHAAVRISTGSGTYQAETGWSEGSPITSKGNWATFSTFTLTCSSIGEETKCETAFAKHASVSQCFLNYGFDRWGWTNGPLNNGTHVFDIYAGAGQCNTSKGALAGRLTVVYAGSTATVTFEMYNGYTMEETHLYVGNDPLPKFKQGKNLVETVAPGQYPYKHEDLDRMVDDAYTVSGLSGGIYVVAHAVVCK